MNELNISWSEYNSMANKIAADIKREWLDITNHKTLIIGMSRGGLPLAVNLSHLLQLPMSIINYRRLDGIDETTPELFHQHEHDITEYHIILVDDIHDSGHSMSICRDYLNKLYPDFDPLGGGKVITTALVYNTHFDGIRKNDYGLDFNGMIIDTSKGHPWVNFPWEKNNESVIAYMTTRRSAEISQAMLECLQNTNYSTESIGPQ